MGPIHLGGGRQRHPDTHAVVQVSQLIVKAQDSATVLARVQLKVQHGKNKKYTAQYNTYLK